MIKIIVLELDTRNCEKSYNNTKIQNVFYRMDSFIKAMKSVDRPRYEQLSEFLGELAEMFAVKTIFTRLAARIDHKFKSAVKYAFDTCRYSLAKITFERWFPSESPAHLVISILVYGRREAVFVIYGYVSWYASECAAVFIQVAEKYIIGDATECPVKRMLSEHRGFGKGALMTEWH